MPEEKKALHKNYHDKLYGFPIHDDAELFCRLILKLISRIKLGNDFEEGENFRKAYHNFNIKKIASYKEADRKRLLSDPGIIRNRLKVNAAIENAKTILTTSKRIWLV